MPPPDKVAVGGDAGATDYRVQPLDVLDISVFQVPDLTKTVEVSSSGQISLPLIGAVAVAGKSVSGVETEIAAKLRANYLQAPQVSVFVKESANSRVTVDGAVKNPGVYPVKGQITLLQALATAGGIDLSIADRQGIIVLRKIGGRVQAAKFDYSAISIGKASDPAVYPGDVIKVDQCGMRAAFKGLRQSIPVFGLFSPLL